MKFQSVVSRFYHEDSYFVKQIWKWFFGLLIFEKKCVCNHCVLDIAHKNFNWVCNKLGDFQIVKSWILDFFLIEIYASWNQIKYLEFFVVDFHWLHDSHSCLKLESFTHLENFGKKAYCICSNVQIFTFKFFKKEIHVGLGNNNSLDDI